jgi:hypothetical protein
MHEDDGWALARLLSHPQAASVHSHAASIHARKDVARREVHKVPLTTGKGQAKE